MRALLRRWLVLAGAAFALCVAHGCKSESGQPSQLDAMEWIDEVERAHAEADRDAPADASRVLRKALAAKVPSDVLPRHRVVVHQDLLFRIARAELDAARPAQALAAADQGLLLGRDPSLFAANLFVVRGEALERLGRDTEAASAYYEALEINRKLLHHLLAARDAGQP